MLLPFSLRLRISVLSALSANPDDFVNLSYSLNIALIASLVFVVMTAISSAYATVFFFTPLQSCSHNSIIEVDIPTRDKSHLTLMYYFMKVLTYLQ